MERNPGAAMPGVRAIPDYVSLHPGCTVLFVEPNRNYYVMVGRTEAMFQIIAFSSLVLERVLMRARWLSTILYSTLFAFSLCGDASAQRVRVLSSDLNFIMDCKDRDPSTLEGPIEEFLRREGFDVLNLAGVQRRHIWFSALEVEIIGLDKARHMIHFRSPHAPKNVARLQGHYFVGLRTPPPSQRAPEVEDALLKFVTDQLQCGFRQVTRQENGADVADLYENEIRRVENLFREADQLNGRQPR
jgi:hypothetical protein